MNPPTGEVMYSVGRGRGPWRPNQSAIELRRPQNVPASSETPVLGNATNDEDQNPPPIAAQSKLSVNAKEFVPRGFACSASNGSAEQTLNPSANSFEGSNQYDELSEDSHDEWIFHHLSDVIKNLTDNPGHFDQFVKPLLDELSPMLAVEEAVENIVSVIINQSIAERNFRYSGARLCNALNNRYKPGEKSVFRRVLLNKLCEEHEKIESNLELNPNQVYGFVHYMGEMYIQLELNRGLGVRIAILGDALLDALKILIQVPSLDNIKNTCGVLKLAGRMLDIDNVDVMNTLFTDLENLLGDERAGARVREMVSNILKLRKDNWGHVLSSENPGTLTGSDSKSSMPTWVNDGMTYGPDGEALSAEEYKFLNESCEDNETVSIGDEVTVWDPDVNETENAEIMAAFQEFINQKPQS